MAYGGLTAFTLWPLVEYVASALVDLEMHLLTDAEGLDVTLLLEVTAGQGSSLGHRFEHLAAIIDGVKDKTRVGVCLDTCHIFAAGYDIRSEADYLRTMDNFDRQVGLVDDLADAFDAHARRVLADEVPASRPRDHLGKRRLARSRHVLQQHVALTQQSHHHLLYRVPLSDNYIFNIIDWSTRKLIVSAPTYSPNSSWLAQQIRNSAT